jgi:putative FmdB family regulatory protein
MPLYEYECEACAQRFERIQKFSDPPVDTCPSCGGPVRKLLSSPAIQFKGSGWYITDYAKKGKDGKESPASKGAKDVADGSKADTPTAKDAPAADAKPAAPAKPD